MARAVRSNKRSHSIATRTALSHIALAVVIVGFACVCTYFMLYAYVRRNLEQELTAQATDIAQIEMNFTDQYLLSERVYAYEKLTKATVLFINQNNVVTRVTQDDDFAFFADDYDETADERTVRIIDAIDQVFFARILEGETVSDIRLFEFVKREILFAGAPVYDPFGNIMGGVVLIQPINIVTEQSQMMLLILLIVLTASIPIAIAVSLKLSRRLTSPILAINSGAKELVEGRYGSKLDIDAEDETGELADTLNTLSARLQSVFGSLREERDKLDLIVNGIGEGIIATDRYLGVVHCNQSFMELMEYEKSPDSAPEGDVSDILGKCMSTGARERATWKDSAGRDMLALATPLRSADGRVLGAVCLLQDVSERERLEQMRRDYVANISHELRTPLTGIRGMVEPLMDDIFESDAERRECYNVIYQETIRLEKLIKEMLEMSQLEAGRASVELGPVAVNDALEFAVKMVSQTAANANIEIITDIGADRLFCVGNEDRILQVITVFLDNALSFTPSGGKITVSARRERGRVIISVKDTGVGIEPKDLLHIWERFYKVDKSRMRTKGTGLGLAIAKLLVELMMGETGVITEVGAGSEFWFSLPAAED